LDLLERIARDGASGCGQCLDGVGVRSGVSVPFPRGVFHLAVSDSAV